MNLPLWTLIPAVFFITLIYLGLGNVGYWDYSIKDLFNGNLLVSLGIGITYLGEFSYRRFKK